MTAPQARAPADRTPFALQIDSLDLKGQGVGRRDGKAVFVQGALPGEVVVVEPVRIKASFETADLLEVRRSSVLRTAPRCPHFGLHAGACGGCSLQHLEPRAQVAIKQRALEDALWHIGRLRPELLLRPIHGPSWGYRQRARLSSRYVVNKEGVLVGFHERASSYVADMRECHVLPAWLSALLPALRELIGALSIRDRLPQIEVALAEAPRPASGPAAADARVLVLRHLSPFGAADLDVLAAFASRHEVQFWAQPAGPDTAHPIAVTGDAPELLLRLDEFGVEIPFMPTDFTQVNHATNAVLVRRALRLLEVLPGERVIDFFCGLGNFTLPLATRAGQVLGIEGAAGLVARAQQAARRNRLEARTRFVARNLFDWSTDDWERAWAEMGGVDRVLIDPPRDGALAIVRALAVSAQRPRRIVYVSCNPATLARDCAVLAHEGPWRLRAAGVVNMFPHTSHVESIAVLEPAST